MKAIPFVFVIGVIVLLSCVGQEPVQPGTTGLVYFSITDKQLDMANVTSVDVTISKIELHKTGTESLKCSLSLCGCKCYPEGQTPEELNGTLCGINCLGEFNVTGCKVVDNACTEVYAGENDSANVEESAWVAVLNESKTYDLMQLTGVEELVSSANIESGEYNIVRLYISDVKVTLNGEEKTAKLPSGKIDINIAFTIAANKTHLVSFDFNLNDSLHITGDGQIIMAPVIKVDVSKDVELNITDGKVKRIRAEREVQKEVGMDENGTVGEGKRIMADLNLTVGDDGRIRIQERARNETEQQGQPQQYDVSARVNGFTPSTLTIKAGDTVRWVFRDSFAHRLVSDAAGFDSMARYQDQVWTYTFNQAGTFAYHDSINANAQGTIIVEQ
jgi:plastocyanin